MGWSDVEDAMERIVVGVDDSPGSVAALRWALRLAAETGARVEAVHAWGLPHGWIDAHPPDLHRWSAEAEEAARAGVDQVVDAAEFAGPTYVEVQRTVIEGSPAKVLVDRSKDADLLVVGSRGRGGFAGLLLGSVSQQCVNHGHVPVVVVPRPE